jgi:hypothetical protein
LLLGAISPDKIKLRFSDRDEADYRVEVERARLAKEKAKMQLTKRMWEP